MAKRIKWSEVLPTLTQIADAHYGAIQREHLTGLDLSESAIDRLLQSGFLRPMFPRVYRLPGAAPSWHLRLEAARMSAGPEALAFRQSAAALWGLPHIEGIVEIVTTRRVRPVDGIVVRRRQCWPPQDEATRARIATTSIERTLLDLAAILTPPKLRAAVDTARRLKLTTVERIAERLELTARSGRNGITAMRNVLSELADDGGTESALERDFLALLRRWKIPEPVAQYPVIVDGHVIARLDFAYPELRIGIELDGYAHHSGIEAFERDRRRLVQLTTLGWRILPFTHAQVHEHSAFVMQEVIKARRAALSGPS